MNKILILTILLLTIITVAMADDKERIIIKELRILNQNNAFLSVGDAVKDKCYRDIKSKVGGIYTPEQADEDDLTLAGIGWFFKAFHKTEEVDGGIRLIFNVVENPIIDNIIISGNTVFTSDELKALIPLKKGKVMNYPGKLKSMDRIRKKYEDAGYSLGDIKIMALMPNVTIEQTKAVNDITKLGFSIPANRSDLMIEILETKIDDIIIKDMTKTKEYVIRRELTVKPGDLFYDNSLRKSLANLNRLGIFQDVNVDLQSSKLGTINTIFKVHDARSGNVGLGVGYSPTENFSGMLNFSDNNLFGTARSVSASLQIGQTTSYNLNYNNPWIDSHHTSFNAGIYDTQTITQMVAGANTYSYTEMRKGQRVGFARPYGNWSHGVSFRLDKVYGTDLPVGTASYLDPLINDIQSEKHNRTITLTSQRDTRNSWINAKQGDYLLLSSEIAGFGGDSNFSKWEGEYRYFLPLDNKNSKKISTKEKTLTPDEEEAALVADDETNNNATETAAKPEFTTKDDTKFVLASRVQSGYITGTSPFLDQFRMGGTDTLRGYEEDSFPGVNKLLFNTELRYQPTEIIQFALFADYGDAWGGKFAEMVKADTKLRMRFSYGLGLRVMVPMLGPIRFDYGLTPSGKNRFIFGIGSIY